MSNYSEGAIHALADQLERTGFSNEEVRLLGEKRNLQEILSFLRGNAEIVIKSHVIDCDANPFIPDGWKVEEHTKGGQLRWNPDKIGLYLCYEQKMGLIKGDKLRKLLKDKPVLNACVLDYLLKNPQLIPEEWKGKAVFFWGTIYRSSDGSLFVCCLFWRDDRCHWDYYWLFNDDNPAALSYK